MKGRRKILAADLQGVEVGGSLCPQEILVWEDRSLAAGEEEEVCLRGSLLAGGKGEVVPGTQGVPGLEVGEGEGEPGQLGNPGHSEGVPEGDHLEGTRV